MADRAAVSTAYVAAAANRFSQTSDVFGPLVAYGTSTLVALWDAAVRQPSRFAVSLGGIKDVRYSCL